MPSHWSRDEERITRTRNGVTNREREVVELSHQSSGNWGRNAVFAVMAGVAAFGLYKAGEGHSNSGGERRIESSNGETQDGSGTTTTTEAPIDNTAQEVVRESTVTYSHETLPLATLDAGIAEVGSTVQVALIIDTAPGLRVCDGDVANCASALAGVEGAENKGVIIGHWSVEEDTMSAATPGTSARHVVQVFPPQEVTYTQTDGTTRTVTLTEDNVQVRLGTNAPVALSSVLPANHS